MNLAIFGYFVALVIQSIYIYAIGEVRGGLFLLTRDEQAAPAHRVIYRGVSVLYYMAWLGLVITVLGTCAAVSSNIEQQQRFQRWQSERPNSAPEVRMTPVR